jgi:mRNA interferase RelE/StbE
MGACRSIHTPGYGFSSREMTRRLGLRNRVELQEEPGHIGVWPDRPPIRNGSSRSRPPNVPGRPLPAIPVDPLIGGDSRSGRHNVPPCRPWRAQCSTVPALRARRGLRRVPSATSAAWELITGALADDPWRVGKPLHGPYEGLHAARRGTYRVLYEIDEGKHAIEIRSIRHRGPLHPAPGSAPSGTGRPADGGPNPTPGLP